MMMRRRDAARLHPSTYTLGPKPLVLRRREAMEVPGTFTLSDAAFVPHAPKSTAEASQMGWHKSAGGLNYTVFFWPVQGVYSVHDEDLDPVTVQTFASKQAAVNHIATLDQGAPVKQDLPDRTPTWFFSQSLDGYNGVDVWGGDLATLKHRGDWLRLKGITDYGGTFLVTHVWEKGDAAKVPTDYNIKLRPGERATVQNMEGDGGAYYNIDVIWTGPVYTYKGQQADEAAAGLEPQLTPAEQARPYLLNGPIMQRVRALLASRRGG